MKITFVSYIYPYPERGFNPGIERVIRNEAHALADLGHDVTVICTYRNGGTVQEEWDGPVRLLRVPDLRHIIGRVGSLFSLDMISLSYTISEYSDVLGDSDVIHTFAPLLRRFPDTLTVAHYHHWDEPDTLIEYLYLPTSNRLWLDTFDRVNKVVAVSDYSARELSSHGVPLDKITTVYNGVDTDRFYPGESSLELENFAFANTLLFVGPLIERKGLTYLLSAMEDIVSEHPDTGLLIVGSGSLREDLEGMAKTSGIEQHVRFEGFVSDELLPEYYRYADVFVFPSLLEGFGMVLAEAMVSGCAVVSTNTSSIPEVVGDAGVLVPIENKEKIAGQVISLLSNESSLESAKQNCIDRATRYFTWKASAERLVDVYTNGLYEKKT